MAIYHCSMKPISRSSGRSAVAAAAYRAGEELTNERDGITHDFTRRRDVSFAEIVLPEGSDAAWAKDRSALWNAAEAAEKRKDARVAREFEVALPHELDAEHHQGLAKAFGQHLANTYGVAVDVAIHEPHGKTDVRNHHAHLLLTTRQVEKDGLGEKSLIERDNKWLKAKGLTNSHQQLREVREAWAGLTNQHLEMAGHDVQIDHRSQQDRGLEIAPTEHMGVHATQMERRGMAVNRTRLDQEMAQRNADLIREDPSQVLSVVTGEKSVFNHRDVARALHRYIDGVEDFQGALAKAMASPSLVELAPERASPSGVIEPARFTTKEIRDTEWAMANGVDRMAESKRSTVVPRHREAAFQKMPMLSDEQRLAVEHVTGPGRVAAVVGFAGAGKSTMLFAAREAWENAGFRVHGATLAGKAAEGLEESSGIQSRTLASWEMSWARAERNGQPTLNSKDVFVIDEAGMVSSRQMAKFVAQADRTGAKLVLVGDPEQLQPIQAGAAFRSIAERIGFASLEVVRRQTADWQREASVAFGQHRTGDGLDAYDQKGMIRLVKDSSEARSAVVIEAVADMTDRPEGSRIVLAHRRVDVKALNERIREQLQAAGGLTEEREYQTAFGVRQFAVGDRVMFGENNRDLGVKNGMLGTVEQTREGRLSVRLDSASAKRGRSVEVSLSDYAAIDHGYASTVHKSQGVTVDRAFVMASKTMDRHLTYVAMTRHRESVLMVASEDEFGGIDQLKNQLSRGRQKETTLDYLTRQGPQQDSNVPVVEVAVPLDDLSGEDRDLLQRLSKIGGEQPLVKRREAARQAERILEKTFDAYRARLMEPVERKQRALQDGLDNASRALQSHIKQEPKGMMARFKQKAWQQEKERLTTEWRWSSGARSDYDQEINQPGGIGSHIAKQARQKAEKTCEAVIPLIRQVKQEREEEIKLRFSKELEQKADRSRQRSRGFGR